MEYVVRQPRTKSLLVPVLALAIGAAGAVGLNAALDDTDGGSGSARVIVPDPVTPGAGTAAKDEAGAAAAIARHPATVGSGITVNPGAGTAAKDEAATAAAIARHPSLAGATGVTVNPSTGYPTSLPSTETKDEAATAAAIGNSSSSPLVSRETKDQGAPVGIPSPAAAAKMNGGTGSGTAAKDEAGTAAAIGSEASQSEDEDPFNARTGRPGGP
jgi:hypothetical protein